MKRERAEDIPLGSRGALRRVQIRNYRSIAQCDVELGPLTFLVGPNGSGKSNFLDALQLLADGLNTTLESAIEERGGSIYTRPELPPCAIAVEMEIGGRVARYGLKFARRQGGGLNVIAEELRLDPTELGTGDSFLVRSGRVVHATGVAAALPPELASDRLALVTASGLLPYRPVFEALRTLRAYDFSVPAMVRFRPIGSHDAPLARNGANLVAVVRDLQANAPAVFERILEHMKHVVPSLRGIEVLTAHNSETLSFVQTLPTPADEPSLLHVFHGEDMSDGALRALAVLVGAFQGARPNGRAPLLVGIEEPETALHPGALDVLLSGLFLASGSTQLVVTTHSADLLDSKRVGAEHVRAVSIDSGRTVIGAIDEVSRSALRDRLYSTGELLRLGQLSPDPASAAPIHKPILECIGE